MIKRLRKSQRGFTLIELMITLAVSTIVISIITRVVFVQQRSFVDQLAYAETQQNARASISLLKLYARKAGWGMKGHIETAGDAPVGTCFKTGDDSQPELECDRADLDAEDKKAFPNGSDRLRIIAMNPFDNGGFVQTPRDSPTGTIEVGVQVDPSTLAAIPAAQYIDVGHGLANDTIAVISGECMPGTGPTFASDLVKLSGSSANADVYFQYTYVDLTALDTVVTCDMGYKSGFTFAKAVVADFWIDRTDIEHPVLQMRVDPTKPLDGDATYAVAYDIDDLQVQYLLDTACDPAETDCIAPDFNTPDHNWDEICDDLTPGVPQSDGGCDPTKGAEGKSLSHRERLSRIVGARIAIVARTRRYNPILDLVDDSIATRLGGPLSIQNHTYVGRDDGYRRWIYRATVAMRNTEL